MSLSSISGTSYPLEYSDQHLKECVEDVKVVSNGLSSIDDALLSQQSCWKLYLQFLQHYHPIDYQQTIVIDEKEEKPQWLDESFMHFVKTVEMIHQHNSNPKTNHKLRLNQFADQPHAYRIPTEEDTLSPSSSSMVWQQQVDQIWNEVAGEEEDQEQDAISDGNLRQPRQLEMEDGETIQVSLLDSFTSIVRNTPAKDTPNHQLRSRHDVDQSHRSLNKIHHKKIRHHPKKHHNKKDLTSRHHSYYRDASDSYRNRSTLKLGDPATALRTRVYMPNSSLPPLAFSSPQVPISKHGMEVELHKSLADGSTTTSSSTKSQQKQQHQSWLGGLFHEPPVKKKKTTTEDDVSWEVPLVDSKDEEDMETATPHDFTTSLNWATSNNPDGVALVHNVFDQGTCGSCWAFAATGSVETSAARNAARDYFSKGLQQMIDNHTTTSSTEPENPMVAMKQLMEQTQIVEAETFIQLNLSIQELLDCDTAADQGCVGGNPLLAFFYIHRYGLVPWDEYPYVGYGQHLSSRTPHVPRTSPTTVVSPTTSTEKQKEETSSDDSFDSSLWDPFHTGQDDTTSNIPKSNTDATSTCQLDKIANPIATVQSWGLLHRNHEDLIELALKYVGPVAVGMNGADPTFVNYGGGIFDAPDCDQGANHALLIVGYGEENVTNDFGQDETVRYWVARNSWGKGWGEEGFVRIKRGPGGKHIPGVCGIARSPSVALGGQLRPNRYEPLMDNAFQMTVMDPTKFKGRNADYSEPSGHDFVSEHSFCDSITPIGTKMHSGCMNVARAYDQNPAIFLVAIGILSAMMAVIPLTFAIMKRRRMARPFEPNSLSLNGSNNSNGSLRRSSGGAPTESTHLLTLKDAYASINQSNSQDGNNKPRRGRSIIIKEDRLEQDPFRLSGKLWDSKHLAASAAEALALERSQDMASAAAATLDSEDENEPLI